MFLEPRARCLIRDWEARARRVVAEFRASCSAHMTDPALRSLIESLRRDSAEFAQFWNQYGVLEREGGERTFNHKRDGLLRYAQVTFELAGRPDLKLTMLVPCAAEIVSADALPGVAQIASVDAVPGGLARTTKHSPSP